MFEFIALFKNNHILNKSIEYGQIATLLCSG